MSSFTLKYLKSRVSCPNPCDVLVLAETVHHICLKIVELDTFQLRWSWEYVALMAGAFIFHIVFV